MVAIATDSLKQKFADLLFKEVIDTSDSNEIYIGIGKADAYDSSDAVITPLQTLEEEREARANLQSVKKVTGTSFVIPRNNWTSGTIYASWSDDIVGYPSNAYYTLTEDQEIYICLQQGKDATGTANPSIVKPSFTDAGVNQVEAFKTSDGYVWKLMYAISASRAGTFLSSSFLPVQNITIDSSSANAFELQQLNIQNTPIRGAILGFDITNGGSGYVTAPAITIKGNGTGAAATATISGGTIVKVEMDNESGGLGSGYDFASASVTGNASLRPIIAPADGIGKSSIKDLKSSSVMFNIKPNGSEGDTFNITNDFRQILLIQNIDLTDSAAAGPRFTNNSAKAGRFMTITTTISAAAFAVDEVITGGTSGVTAFVDELDSASGNKIFFHQNSNSIAGEFSDGEAITGSGSGSATIDSGNKYSLVDAYSGDVLYIENRARVIRSSAQTEDIKVIITV
tara:strand:- start:2165 stop:3532 length:1368 start_codon:yes stop_codon:yes gene_type:complete